MTRDAEAGPPVTGEAATVVSELGATVSAGEGASRTAGFAGDLGALPVIERSHYLFADVLAQGGMGKIFRATDRRLGRAVAIKELLAPSPELAARFEREVRLTARLQHPSIVSLHEAGRWPTGQPFFAMELVEGEPLDAVIGRTTRLAERLALLPHALAVADALAYAHSVGVIHRDLKPQNVLVGRFGETVVIDWGLAKELDRAADAPAVPALGTGSGDDGGHQTRLGSVLGTPAYMPPEQAEAYEVDRRADVYALGALLYHLLAGRPPYQAASSAELLRQVIDAPCRPLAEVAPEVPRELAAIVTTAMARDPAGRYPSARELADDLRRFQTGQLVAVHRYTLAGLVRRWLRRHRAVVAVSAAALVALAVIGGVSVSRVIAERDAAHRAERAEAAARARAEAQRSASEGLVGFMLGELQPQLERVGRLALLHGVATRVDAYYADIDGTGLDATARARRADALHLLGVVLDATGDPATAQRAFERAIDLRAAAARAGELAAIVDQARSRNELAVTRMEQGDLDGAAHALEQARDVLTARADRGPRGELALATALRRLGVIASQRGDLAGARVTLERALERAQAAASAPGDRDGALEVPKIYDRLVDVRRAAGDLDGAQAMAEAGLAARRAMLARDPGALDVQAALSVSHDKLFALAVARDDAAGAARAADAAVAAIEPLVARDPDNADWGRQLLVALLRTGDVAESAGDLPRALRQFQAAQAVAERLVVLQPGLLERLTDLSSVLTRVGALQAAHGDLDAAVATQTRAVDLARQASEAAPDNHALRRDLGVAHEYLGDAYLARGDAPAAARAYQARVEIQRALLADDPNNPVLQRVLVNTEFLLGKALAADPARRAEGIATMTRALADLEARERAGTLGPEWDLTGYRALVRAAGKR